MAQVRVSNLPPHLNDEQVRELVSAFGTLKQFSLPKDVADPAKNTGYALIEYEASEVTDVAISALNGLEICGCALEVKWEPAPAPPEPAVLYKLELRGLATAETLADDGEYRAVLADVEAECHLERALVVNFSNR